MSRFELICTSLYSSYVNISKKNGIEPIPYRLFKIRMQIWEW